MLECLLSQQEISVARTTHQLGLLVKQINFSMWSFFMTMLVASSMKNIIKSYFIPFHSSSETLFMVDEISKWGKVIDLPTIGIPSPLNLKQLFQQVQMLNYIVMLIQLYFAPFLLHNNKHH
jgi:hypothetical protein